MKKIGRTSFTALIILVSLASTNGTVPQVNESLSTILIFHNSLNSSIKNSSIETRDYKKKEEPVEDEVAVKFGQESQEDIQILKTEMLPNFVKPLQRKQVADMFGSKNQHVWVSEQKIGQEYEDFVSGIPDEEFNISSAGVSPNVTTMQFPNVTTNKLTPTRLENENRNSNKADSFGLKNKSTGSYEKRSLGVWEVDELAVAWPLSVAKCIASPSRYWVGLMRRRRATLEDLSCNQVPVDFQGHWDLLYTDFRSFIISNKAIVAKGAKIYKDHFRTLDTSIPFYKVFCPSKDTIEMLFDLHMPRKDKDGTKGRFQCITMTRRTANAEGMSARIVESVAPVAEKNFIDCFGRTSADRVLFNVRRHPPNEPMYGSKIIRTNIPDKSQGTECSFIPKAFLGVYKYVAKETGEKHLVRFKPEGYAAYGNGFANGWYVANTMVAYKQMYCLPKYDGVRIYAELVKDKQYQCLTLQHSKDSSKIFGAVVVANVSSIEEMTCNVYFKLPEGMDAKYFPVLLKRNEPSIDVHAVLDETKQQIKEMETEALNPEVRKQRQVVLDCKEILRKEKRHRVTQKRRKQVEKKLSQFTRKEPKPKQKRGLGLELNHHLREHQHNYEKHGRAPRGRHRRKRSIEKCGFHMDDVIGRYRTLANRQVEFGSDFYEAMGEPDELTTHSLFSITNRRIKFYRILCSSDTVTAFMKTGDFERGNGDIEPQAVFRCLMLFKNGTEIIVSVEDTIKKSLFQGFLPCTDPRTNSADAHISILSNPNVSSASRHSTEFVTPGVTPPPALSHSLLVLKEHDSSCDQHMAKFVGIYLPYSRQEIANFSTTNPRRSNQIEIGHDFYKAIGVSDKRFDIFKRMNKPIWFYKLKCRSSSRVKAFTKLYDTTEIGSRTFDGAMAIFRCVVLQRVSHEIIGTVLDSRHPPSYRGKLECVYPGSKKLELVGMSHQFKLYNPNVTESSPGTNTNVPVQVNAKGSTLDHTTVDPKALNRLPVNNPSRASSNAVPFLLPHLVNDGITAQDDGSCWFSNNESRPFWSTDLRQRYIVERLEVYIPHHGLNGMPVSMRNFEIRVGNAGDRNDMLCFSYTGRPRAKSMLKLSCGTLLVGSFVSFHAKGAAVNHLSLCEVIIYGTVATQESVQKIEGKLPVSLPPPTNDIWGRWSSCSKTCDSGTTSRTRNCTGDPCAGTNTEHMLCWIDKCRVQSPSLSIKRRNAEVEAGVWSECSTTCGTGVMTRVKICVVHPCGTETKACKLKPCEHNVHVNVHVNTHITSQGGEAVDIPISQGGAGERTYSQWSKCSKSCGSGTQTRTVSCKDNKCSHGSVESRPCNLEACAAMAPQGWTSWTEWSKCPVTCGASGLHSRERTYRCINCDGQDEIQRQSKSCGLAPCPVDGIWTQWSQWTPCDKLCGGGTQCRLRECDNPAPQNGGEDCTGSPRDERTCNVQPCAVNYKYTLWTTWSDCSVTCGGGLRSRKRTCIPPQHGGLACPSEGLEQSEACLHRVKDQCIGTWAPWSAWSDCSKKCGGGVEVMTRKCTRGMSCPMGPQEQQRSCNTHLCAIDGSWSAWGHWGHCSVTCNKGIKKRSRKCNNPTPSLNGQECPGHNKEEDDCFLRQCDIDGMWGNWEKYGPCSATCGIEGIHHRKRLCNHPEPSGKGKLCQGIEQEEERCNQVPCPIINQDTAIKKTSVKSSTVAINDTHIEEYIQKGTVGVLRCFGGNAKLQLQDPKTHWYNARREPVELERATVLKSGDLKFSDIQAADSGRYYCKVRGVNRDGDYVKHEVVHQLQVFVIPEVSFAVEFRYDTLACDTTPTKRKEMYLRETMKKICHGDTCRMENLKTKCHERIFKPGTSVLGAQIWVSLILLPSPNDVPPPCQTSCKEKVIAQHLITSYEKIHKFVTEDQNRTNDTLYEKSSLRKTLHVNCPGGWYHRNIRCLSCDPGFYSRHGYSECVPCLVGSFQPERAQSKCINCTTNYTTAHVGSTDGTDCVDPLTAALFRFFEDIKIVGAQVPNSRKIVVIFGCLLTFILVFVILPTVVICGVLRWTNIGRRYRKYLPQWFPGALRRSSSGGGKVDGDGGSGGGGGGGGAGDGEGYTSDATALLLDSTQKTRPDMYQTVVQASGVSKASEKFKNLSSSKPPTAREMVARERNRSYNASPITIPNYSYNYSSGFKKPETVKKGNRSRNASPPSSYASGRRPMMKQNRKPHMRDGVGGSSLERSADANKGKVKDSIPGTILPPIVQQPPKGRPEIASEVQKVNRINDAQAIKEQPPPSPRKGIGEMSGVLGQAVMPNVDPISEPAERIESEEKTTTPVAVSHVDASNDYQPTSVRQLVTSSKLAKPQAVKNADQMSIPAQTNITIPGTVQLRKDHASAFEPVQSAAKNTVSANKRSSPVAPLGSASKRVDISSTTKAPTESFVSLTSISETNHQATIDDDDNTPESTLFWTRPPSTAAAPSSSRRSRSREKSLKRQIREQEREEREKRRADSQTTASVRATRHQTTENDRTPTVTPHPPSLEDAKGSVSHPRSRLSYRNRSRSPNPMLRHTRH